MCDTLCVLLFSGLLCSALKLWVDEPANLPKMSEVFDSTSNHTHLFSVHSTQAGRQVYIRFEATTDDAMGMNMVSKVSLPTRIGNGSMNAVIPLKVGDFHMLGGRSDLQLLWKWLKLAPVASAM